MGLIKPGGILGLIRDIGVCEALQRAFRISGAISGDIDKDLQLKLELAERPHNLIVD